MSRRTALFILCALVLAGGFPCPALAESMGEAVTRVVDGLDLSGLEAALDGDVPLPEGGSLSATVLAIARGDMALSFGEVMAWLTSGFTSAVRSSLARLTGLVAPAVLWSILRRLSGRSAEAGKTVCYLTVCVYLTADLGEHMALSTASMEKISTGMQSLFPLLLTLMSAVGGPSSTALMEPAVVAASGGMAAFIRHVTLPLATASAVLTILCHLGEGVRVNRLAALMHQAAAWTLGLCFTAFIGVLTTRGVTAAAVDGITVRTAKYAMDNLIPMVGGLFADTVDTLIGASLTVQSALGVTGLVVIVGWAMAPLCRTLAAALLYRLASALMQPVAEGELALCIHDFSRILMLLFVLQLCTAAMFLLLIAQLVAVSGFTLMLR